FTFAEPAPAELLAQAAQDAQELDLQFLWECAPQEEFDSAALAADYFGHTPSAVERAALLMRLHGAPVYFHRLGKGTYRPKPPDMQAAALATQEKKRKQAEKQQQWVDEMDYVGLSEEFVKIAETFLIRPDYNWMPCKALDSSLAPVQK